MSKLTLLQKIHAIMKEVDYIQKSDKKVNNQYRFVSHDQVAELFHKKLVEHGIVALPSVREFRQDGNRTEMLIDVKFINVDDADDCFTVQSLGYGVDPSDKGPGKAMSYAVKYAFLKVFCLETGDDPDEQQNTRHEPMVKSQSKVECITTGKITAEQKATLESKLKSCPIEFKKTFFSFMKSKCKATVLEDIAIKDYNDCLSRVDTFLKEVVNA